MRLSKKQYTLAAAALGSSLAFIDASAVIVALPTIQKSLGLGLAGEQWVFLAYSLALAALYLIGGALGDRFGYRKIFARGVIGFAIASIIAGASTSGAMLITARVLQGIAGAFVTTNSLAWLRNVYDENAGKAIGLWTSLTGISTVIAPPLGGAFTQWLSWRWIFYINVPLACLIIYWSARSAEDQKHDNSSKPLDLVGAMFIAAGLSLVTYYLVQGAKTGFAQLWWAIVAGMASLVAFALTEKRLKQPMLPLEVFRIRNLSMVNLETLLIYGALSGIFVYFTLYLQFLGLSPLASSLFLIPASLMLIFFASYFGGLADRQGPRKLLTAGPALIGFGALIFSLINTRGQVWTRGSVGIIVFSVGLAMMVAPITTVALRSAPTKFAGLASGINNTVARIGGLVVIAVIGAIISIAFFGRVSDKKAVPLGLHQSARAVVEASHHGFRVGMVVVALVAFVAAAIGWFGISNDNLIAKKAT